MVKRSTEHCATGKMMLLRKEWPNSNCPRCGHEEETTEHVLKCPGGDEVWQKAIKSLETWMEDHLTAKPLRKAICQRLEEWRSSTITTFRSRDENVEAAIMEQDAIGWQNFLEGRVSKKIQHAQQLHLDALSTRRTGERWLAALIVKMWEVSWDLWDHRNGILHNNENSVKYAKQKREVELEFEEGYEGLARHVRRWFQGGVEAVLKLTPDQRQAFLVNVRAARTLASEADGEGDTHRSQREFMQEWMASLPRR